MVYYSFLMILLSIGITIFYSTAAGTRPLLLLIAIGILVVVLHVGNHTRIYTIYRKFFQLRYRCLKIILALFVVIAYTFLSLHYFHMSTVALFMVLSYFIICLLLEYLNHTKRNRLAEKVKLLAGISLLTIASVQLQYGVASIIALVLGSIVTNFAIIVLLREIIQLYRQNYILEELIMVTLLPILLVVAIIACNHPLALTGTYEWIKLLIDSIIVAGTMVIIPYILLNHLAMHSQQIKYRLSVLFPLITIIIANLFEIESGLESGGVAAFTCLLVIL
jgi:hypothetical protein